MNTQFNKIPIFFRFEDLRIYNKALDYAIWMQHNFNDIQNIKNDSFINRFNSIARQIPIHIAEGSAFSKVQFIEQLKYAKSAVRECLVLTTIAEKCSYFSKNQEADSRNQLMEMTKMLGALITSLQKTGENNHESAYEEETTLHNKSW